MSNLLELREKQGFCYWLYPAWEEENIQHGFLGRTLNASDPFTDVQNKFRTLVDDETAELHLLNQTHSIMVRELTSTSYSGASDSHSPQERQDGDAWIVHQPIPHGFLGIKTADCVPVLLRIKNTPVKAALHCGWRGTVHGLLPTLLEKLIRTNYTLSDVEILFGPSAKPCCFEIGNDIRSDFENAAGKCGIGISEILSTRRERLFADVSGLLAQQARSLGVETRHIIQSDLCTICDSRFFSHRREKSAAGRLLSFIATSANKLG